MTRVTWRGITTDAESAECWEAAATDPELDDVLIRPIPGYGSYRDNTASGNTDNGGGHVDLDFVGYTDEQCRRTETVYRRYGNFAAWRPERRPDGTRYGWQNHGHVLRLDCADLSDAARTQLGDYRAGYNGLPIGGRINKDTGDRSYLAARWLTLKTTLQEDIVTEAQLQQILAAINAVPGRVLGQPVKHPTLKGTWELRDSQWSTNVYAMQAALKESDPASLAQALAPLLNDADVVDAATLEAALRKVLGSLDNAPAGGAL